MNSTTAPTATPDAQPARKRGPLASGNFRWLWFGQSISVIGTAGFTTTLVLWVAALTTGRAWSPLAVSGVFLASGIPTAVFGPFAGVWADRWDKRLTMLRIDVIRTVLVALLIPLAAGVLSPWLPGGDIGLFIHLGALYAMQVLISILDRLFLPAFFALTNDLVPQEQLPAAMGMVQSVFALSIIIGPALAAPLYFLVGPALAVAINAASFGVSALSLAFIAAPPSARSVAEGERPHFWREFGAGARFFFTTRVLVGMLLGAMIAVIGAGAFQALDYFFVTQDLHTPASYYGALSAASGIGLILGTVVIGAVAQRIGLTRVLIIGMIAMGVLAVAYSRMAAFWPAFALLVVLGFFNGSINIAAGPLMMRVTPREMIGRVSSLLDPVIMLATIVGTAISGYLASTVLQGVSLTIAGVDFDSLRLIFGGAGVLFLLGGIFLVFVLREPPLPAEPATDEAAVPTPLGLGTPIEPVTGALGD